MLCFLLIGIERGWGGTIVVFAQNKKPVIAAELIAVDVRMIGISVTDRVILPGMKSLGAWGFGMGIHGRRDLPAL